MKLSGEDYDKLAAALKSHLAKVGIDDLECIRAELDNNPRIKNLDLAYRWRMLHDSGFRIQDR